MNPLLLKIVKETMLDAGKTATSITPFRLAKAWLQFKITALRQAKDAVLIVAGIFSAAFGLKGFLLPNDFIDGGATGIALLFAEVTRQPLWLLLLLVNLPFVYLGIKVIGRRFAFRTALAIGGLAAATAFLDFPLITEEKILIAVFGGFFLGMGIGLAVRGGAVIDGTEVLALFTSRKIGATMGDVILLFNILIFLVAAWLLSLETAMFSVLTYMAAARTVDFVIEGIEEYIGVTIISPKYPEIKWMIVEKMGRGITVFSGKKGIGKSGVRNEQDILFTVITRLEVGQLKAEIAKIDPHAFVVMHHVKDTHGGLIKKRPLAH